MRTFLILALLGRSLAAQECPAGPERDLAAVIAQADSATQDRLLHDCGESISPELIRQLVDAGIALGAKGQFPREERVANIALSLADGIRDPASRARALWLLGRARDSQDAYDEALADYAKSLEAARAAGDKQTEGRALVGTGFTYYNQYEFDKAQEPLKRGLEIALSVGDHMIADNAYLAMSGMHLLSGDYISALRELDLAREEAQKADDRIVVAAATANSGLVFIDMNNPYLAAERLRDAIELYHALGNKRGEMRNVRNLAEVEAANEHPKVAEQLLDRLDAYLAKEPNDRLAMFAAATRVAIANYRHDLPRADREGTKALALAKKTDDQHLLAVMTNLMSHIRFKEKRYREAAAFAESAVELSRTIPAEIPVANQNAGKAYEQLGRIDDAKRALETAVYAIESQLANVPGDEEEQQTFYQDKSGPYYDMFRVLVHMHQPEQAIEWAERSRSRSLIEYLGRTKSAPHEHDTEELRREQELVSLNRKLRELYGTPKRDADAVAKLEEEVREKRLDLEDFQARLYSKHPHMALERGVLPRPTFKDVQKLIPKSGAILQYVVNDEETWLVVIRHNGRPYIRRVNVESFRIRSRVNTFAERVARRDLGTRAEARKLYDLFVKPAEPALQSVTSLCIIPDNALWRVPFQALVDGGDHYLIEGRTMFYAPSLSFLAWYASHLRESEAKRDLLVIANPQLAPETAKLARSVQRDESMGPLPEAEEEARQIKALYRGEATVVTGEAATESFLKRNASRYRIIHLATHAVFDDTSPLHSHLLLAAGKNSSEDGLLEAREIMNLDLAPDLVILSSCETGRGRVRGGDGVIGMSWALLVAGCPTAVVSQWKVGSAGTEKLMTEFHRRLSKLPPDRRRAGAAHALRAAGLAVMQMPEYRYPYDWSAFVVMGNGW